MMSDLKYRSPEELRDIIRWCESKRTTADEQRKLKRALIVRLEQEAAELDQKIHNIGQKEAWARIWLARKEVTRGE